MAKSSKTDSAGGFNGDLLYFTVVVKTIPEKQKKILYDPKPPLGVELVALGHMKPKR